ncbi:hypothetical protein HaLaN_05194 [Haematococcus lacustris]|uniref:Uncharacterized protein n=1 Tax=Haematococcus lacustris TaxID=44745 RepID=A0A699YIE1_HAELA|nr:hypothetical protein HaLaN_05194 [Haematococcus lacustris]
MGGSSGSNGIRKSTLARCVVEEVNAQQGAQVAALLPMELYELMRRLPMLDVAPPGHLTPPLLWPQCVEPVAAQLATSAAD